nr:MAG TPA: hypothetical protein [Caudoviricetes sp.]
MSVILFGWRRHGTAATLRGRAVVLLSQFLLLPAVPAPPTSGAFRVGVRANR